MKEIEEILKRVMGGEPPSVQFRERLKALLMEEVRSRKVVPLRLEVVDAIIGRAISDLLFRRALLEDPEKATREAGFLLTAEELAAFSEMSEEMVESFGGALDVRVSKKIDKGFNGGPGTGK